MYGIQATTGLPALAMAARQPCRRQRLAARRRQSTRQRVPAGANREQWRHSPAFRRSAGKGLENLLALARKAASRRLSLAHAAGGELALADAAALRRRGHFHSGLSRRRQLSDDAARKIPPTLSGVLTLSTCSNVCILTDYPFRWI